MAAEPLVADPADAGDVPVRLLRALRADPGHAAEWAVLFAVQRLSAESGAYAARLRAAAPETSPDRLAERVRDRAEDICRIEGAISGTPFLVALVPAYIALLWEQARMALRIAAIYGHDLADPRLPAEILVMRGVHRTLDAADAAIAQARDPAARREAERRAWPVRLVELGRRIAILAGFLGGSFEDDDARRPGILRTAVGLLIGAAVWVLTWVLPITFMILMAGSATSSTRALATRAIDRYSGRPGGLMGPGRPLRAALWSAALAVSVVAPVALVVATQRWQPGGFHWWHALAALAALALVMVLFALASRRVPRASDADASAER
jgi:hypothetical protein